ncbi:beta-galactosidase/beta-glucuronidase [Sanguibacter keddieii DSM 10542]|uniref:Beta-galactosidase/beta-glucuronidase n=1 Tax=Sanguibacter keddieii (strain ATCC 51767 / DSM 10542 / NCFB 3025 / ST-74) TaxID=446469 RepID=D1BDD9_SANKS|nr:glycoside hydrolase family 2 TIM barrel-domain containing protein [Sanguibacter keddieii]ACZ23143.1 beta-galactosidase/beta-glucuronidase [Sanguibacter keddieii DSM 10542]
MPTSTPTSHPNAVAHSVSTPPVATPPVSTPPRASLQDGTYPRPQLVRERWVDLSGTWGFDHDDADVGLDEGWQHATGLSREIVVPFPPESPASGIADTGFHPVVWYRREITRAELDATGLGDLGSGGTASDSTGPGDTRTGGTGTGDASTRLLVHLGAVDHRADVWLDGTLLGSHEGGSTPFTLDATAALDRTRDTHVLVVRAQDDPHDLEQPRGKQDWELEPHSIWYHRTTGIWQPVWLEAVPRTRVDALTWTPRVDEAAVDLRVDLGRRPAAAVDVLVVLELDGAEVGRATVRSADPRVDVRVLVPALADPARRGALLWAPGTPTLVDARVEIRSAADGAVLDRALPDGAEPGSAPHDSTLLDTVTSYLGLRTVDVADGAFRIDGAPVRLRSVLSQGFWPQSHLAAPSAAALRAEVELILELGFNAVRVHQKIEDPRFLYWADRLGLLVWVEAPSAYRFSPTAVQRMLHEWTEVVARDRSHPSVVTWVPLNESWGVEEIAQDPQAEHYARALWHLTKALDGTRPVVSNDGWEHTDSDIWTFHDYDGDPQGIADRYRDDASIGELLAGTGPAGRRMRLGAEPDRGQPVMLTELGGIALYPRGGAGAWGYSTATSAWDLDARFAALMAAVHGTALAGFCYTQLTDTLQEANGLVTADRLPKVPAAQIRAAVTGEPVDGALTARRSLVRSLPVRGTARLLQKVRSTAARRR